MAAASSEVGSALALSAGAAFAGWTPVPAPAPLPAPAWTPEAVDTSQAVTVAVCSPNSGARRATTPWHAVSFTATPIIDTLRGK